MSLTPDQLAGLTTPESAKAALRALSEQGMGNSQGAGSLSLDQLASVAGIDLPTTPDLTGWASLLHDSAHATPLLITGTIALLIGVMLWFLGDKALRSVGVIIFGLLGTAIGAGLELLTSQAVSATTLAAGGIGGLGGVCLGVVAVGLLSRSICVFTGSATGVLAAMLLAVGPTQLASIAPSNTGSPSAAAQSPSARVLKVAGPDRAQIQERIDELNRKLETLDRNRARAAGAGGDAKTDAESNASSEPLTALKEQLTSWAGDAQVAPSSLLMGSAAGGVAALLLSLVMGRWSRRFAAASLGSGLAMLGLGAVLIAVDSATVPSNTMLAGGWIVLALGRSFVPRAAKPAPATD